VGVLVIVRLAFSRLLSDITLSNKIGTVIYFEFHFLIKIILTVSWNQT